MNSVDQCRCWGSSRPFLLVNSIDGLLDHARRVDGVELNGFTDFSRFYWQDHPFARGWSLVPIFVPLSRAVTCLCVCYCLVGLCLLLFSLSFNLGKLWLQQRTLRLADLRGLDTAFWRGPWIFHFDSFERSRRFFNGLETMLRLLVLEPLSRFFNEKFHNRQLLV